MGVYTPVQTKVTRHTAIGATQALAKFTGRLPGAASLTKAPVPRHAAAQKEKTATPTSHNS